MRCNIFARYRNWKSCVIGKMEVSILEHFILYKETNCNVVNRSNCETVDWYLSHQSKVTYFIRNDLKSLDRFPNYEWRLIKNIYLPVIHVPLKLFGDNEPASHSSREIPDARGVLEAEESGLPVRRTVAAMTKPSTTTATKQPARNRRQFRCLFFVIRSWNNYQTEPGEG